MKSRRPKKSHECDLDAGEENADATNVPCTTDVSAARKRHKYAAHFGPLRLNAITLPEAMPAPRTRGDRTPGELTVTAEDYKLRAAERALTYVEPGMKLGLGTGSTAAKFVELLGKKVKDGLDVLCVPTSEATAAQARALGIPLTTLDEHPDLDLTIDGADEINGEVMLIKGGGGALLREKIVAAASARLIIIADYSKKVVTLGKFPLPIEIVPFGYVSTLETVTELAAGAGCAGDIALRRLPNGKPFMTDNGNYILDCAFESIDEPDSLDMMLKMIPGVVENGLFLGMAERAIIVGPDGIEEIESPDYAEFDDMEDGQ